MDERENKDEYNMNIKKKVKNKGMKEYIKEERNVWSMMLFPFNVV